MITIPLLLSIYELLTKRGVPSFAKYALSTMLVLVTGFRYNGGNDFFNYVDIYNKIEYSDTHVEFCFKQICFFLNWLGLGVHSLFLVCSLLTILPISYILKKNYSRFYCTGITLYLGTYIFFESWNTVRQAISMSFAALAVFAYHNGIPNKVRLGRNLTTILLFVIACLFHRSFVFILPFFVLITFNKIRVNILYTSALLIVTFFIGKAMNSVYGYIILLLPGSFSDSHYLNEIETRGVSTGFFQIYLCLSVIAISIYLKIKKKIVRRDIFVEKLYVLFLFGVCIYNFFMGFYIGLRFYWYFYLFIIFLLLEIFKNIERKYNFLIYFGFISTLLVFTYISLQTDYYKNVDIHINLFNTY